MHDTTVKLVDLCRRLREAAPLSLGRHAARAGTGVAADGDVALGTRGPRRLLGRA